MATLLQHRSFVLIGRLVLGLAALLGPPPAGAGTLVDAVAAEVNGEVVAASDIGLARALGLFGFSPSNDPIGPDDALRFIDALLVVQEAERLRIEGGPAEREAAWGQAADRAGGSTALAAWLREVGIAEAWARRLADRDLARRRFVEARFRAFAFVSEAQVAEALGPGDHSGAARERARAALAEEAAGRALAEWLAEARLRAEIRRPAIPPSGIPAPFPMPASRKTSEAAGQNPRRMPADCRDLGACVDAGAGGKYWRDMGAAATDAPVPARAA
jgi:hypothetical protein